MSSALPHVGLRSSQRSCVLVPVSWAGGKALSTFGVDVSKELSSEAAPGDVVLDGGTLIPVAIRQPWDFCPSCQLSCVFVGGTTLSAVRLGRVENSGRTTAAGSRVPGLHGEP